MDNKKFTKFRKTAIAALCAVSVTCTGLAAACAHTVPEEPSESKTQRVDNQLLKNGNFEYADVPEDAVYLIKNVKNWSRSGDSSGTMSGIIDTSKTAWSKIDDPELKDKLNYNNDLNSSDPDYDNLHVDYNGMDSDDILYVDSYAAGFKEDSDVKDSDDIVAIHGSYKDFMGVQGDSENGYTYNGKTVYASDNEEIAEFYYDSDFTDPIRYTRIANPQTHLGEYSESDGKHYLGGTQIYLDENGNYFLDEKLENSVGNVLMIHNFPTNRKYNGIEQHYSSQSITLEANTAAEISVWVKTADLKFDKGFLQINDEDRGAYIEVTQTVGSTEIDSFKIRAINTEKILSDESLNLTEEVSSNGWLKYTIYVNACDFASSTISINLGLGDSQNSQKVTGYAFFDDVEVKKFIDFTDEGCSFNDEIKAKIYDTNTDESARKSSYCSLVSEADDKIFIADKEVRKKNDLRYSDRFYYLIDLASENVEGAEEKTFIPFGSASLNAALALSVEESGGKTYVSSSNNEATVTGLTITTQENCVLPDEMKKTGGRPTYNDLIGIYGSEHAEFKKEDFGSNTGNKDFRDLSGRLNSSLSGDKGLKALSKFGNENGNMLVILSAYGASYTATLENKETADLFTVNGYKTENSANYKIISFWVKTSDMSGNTAATVALIDKEDKDNKASFTIDTTDKETNIGENKDIYSGWVQCFFFVHNDTETEKEFKLEFSFGNQNIASASATSYAAGWVAIANMQSLDVTEDVFKLVSEGDYSKKLEFTEEDENTGKVFDEANGMSNVKTGVAAPSAYKGVNGGSSYVSGKTFGDDYDKQNNPKNGITGLINRDSFEKYKNALEIAKAFNPSITDATGAWNEVFGKDCYQPLIIVDSLRTYHDRAQANADNFKQYYVLKNGEYKPVTELPEEEQVFDEDETYYSAAQLVKNYGYIGESKSLSSGSYTTVSVKVKVSGDAVAYVYLVEPSTGDVMKFETPKYTFFYDTEGNVLSEEFDSEWNETEHRNAIVYTLRDDGLYEDKDGKIFANLYNLTTRFKYAKFENNTFYQKSENGDYERVDYDDLQDGVLYYSLENGEYKLASHYLVVDEQRLYEYDSSSAKYYYMVEGKRGVEVNNFSAGIARYSAAEEASNPEYSVEITDTEGKWVTVNFIIHTGNNEKEYRLELWSGKRGETGVTNGEDTSVNGAVAFDFSSYSVTESNYSNILSKYENDIIEVYKKLILSKDATKLTDNVKTIDDYVKVIQELGITEQERTAALGELAGYEARYYTFTLYDSAQFVPFNKNTAESGQTGYDYTIDDYSETLAYFRTYDKNNLSHNIFADYSAVDQSISLNTSGDSSSSDNESNNSTDDGSGWLLITSIIFAVVMLFVLAAVFVRYLWKKFGAKRSQKKFRQNNYKQRDRYIRKLGLIKIAPVEENNDSATPETPEATPDAEPDKDGAETSEEVSAEPNVAGEVTEEKEISDGEISNGETSDSEAPNSEVSEGETSADDDKKDE